MYTLYIHCVPKKRPRVKWLHLTGGVDKSVKFSCQIFSAFNQERRQVEHSNSRFESIRYAHRFESIRFVKIRFLKNWPFDSLFVMQFLH